MTTVIEIVDTAVKIGLGALISGVTTYLVTNKNHKHERNHGLVVYRRDRLVEITEHIQKAGVLINQIVYGINLKNRHRNNVPKDIDLSDEIEKVKDALSLLSAAFSASHLISDHELSGLIKEYWDIWNSMNQSFLDQERDNWNEYNEIREKDIAVKLKLYEQFSKSLEKIYA